MSMTVLAGNTVRVANVFYDFNGEMVDPTLIKFRIYSEKYELEQEIDLGEGNRVRTGVYYYDYVTSEEPGVQKIVEFYGEIDGHPSFIRERIYTTFMSD